MEINGKESPTKKGSLSVTTPQKLDPGRLGLLCRLLFRSKRPSFFHWSKVRVTPRLVFTSGSRSTVSTLLRFDQPWVPGERSCSCFYLHDNLTGVGSSSSDWIRLSRRLSPIPPVPEFLSCPFPVPV